MKEQIKLLIEQHRLFKQEAEVELNLSKGFHVYTLNKEIEMRTIFISELEGLLKQC
jgi:hypothetical protein